MPAADGCAVGRDEWGGLLLTCPFSTPKYVVDMEGILAIRWSSEREGGVRRSGLFFATNLRLFDPECLLKQLQKESPPNTHRKKIK